MLEKRNQTGRFWLAALVCAAVMLGIRPLWAQESVEAGEQGSIADWSAYPFAELQDGFEPLALTDAAEGNVRRVFFATNRNPQPPNDPKDFGNELHPATHFGSADMASEGGRWRLRHLHVASEPLELTLQAVASFPSWIFSLEHDDRPALPRIESGSPLSLFVQSFAEPGTDVVVFIHGAAFDFRGALSTAARLSELYQLPNRKIQVLLFSYPTNGVTSPRDYFDDRDDAGQSGYALSKAFGLLLEFLDSLRQTTSAGRVVFVAHSLGAYATRVAVQAIDGRASRPPRVFDYAFLMAGDDDRDTLSEAGKMRPLLNLASEVIVYHASNDGLMLLSSVGNFRRPIGFHGPRRVNSEDYGDVVVYAVDATEFSTVQDKAGHRYYLRSPRVIEDMTAVMTGQDPDVIAGRTKIGPRKYRLKK